MNCSQPGSFVHGIFQARIVEWVAISFSRGSFHPRDRAWVSYICILHWQVDCLPPSHLGNPSIRMLQFKRKKKEAIGFWEPLKKGVVGRRKLKTQHKFGSRFRTLWPWVVYSIPGSLKQNKHWDSCMFLKYICPEVRFLEREVSQKEKNKYVVSLICEI